MAYVDCPECCTQVSENAIACPTCGELIKDRVQQKSEHEEDGSRDDPADEQPIARIDRVGAWCPHCGHRNSSQTTGGLGCLILIALLVSVIGILLIPLLPKTWHCRECKHQWRG